MSALPSTRVHLPVAHYVILLEHLHRRSECTSFHAAAASRLRKGPQCFVTTGLPLVCPNLSQHKKLQDMLHLRVKMWVLKVGI
jgi:hypothetical protein